MLIQSRFQPIPVREVCCVCQQDEQPTYLLMINVDFADKKGSVLRLVVLYSWVFMINGEALFKLFFPKRVFCAYHKRRRDPKLNLHSTML